MLLIFPVDSLSMITTSFSWQRVSAMCEPMNPRPPVTAIFLFLIFKSPYYLFILDSSTNVIKL